ncbi:MAG: hypothetical protein NTX80_01715 [Candidatus Saccharibacteria bacterium]|nr:hypothetical protein [Candidatus Saccharibacteria bacterium]
MQRFRTILSKLALLSAALIISGAPRAFALVGPHSFTNTETGDVYLGGDYIELGISKPGSFGTTLGTIPTGFFGTAIASVGMTTNPSGLGETPDLIMDYFLPGSPEERWVVGYKENGTPVTGSNSLLMNNIYNNSLDMPDNIVTNQSTGDLLKATSLGTLNNKLQTTQVISFNRADKYFRNQVTLKNVGVAPIDSVRFMRNFDPDNTVFQGGSYTTHNTIPFTQEAGDGKAVVIADTNLPDQPVDPVKAVNGSDSPIMFYSSDSRARVSTYGFTNKNPYQAQVYDEALPKGTDIVSDIAITIAFDVGTLAPGASETVVYYTSLDNRDFTEVVAAIESNDSDNIEKAIEDAAPNNGDSNGDGIADSTQDSVAAFPNSVVGGGAYQTLTSSGDCSTVKEVSGGAVETFGVDSLYKYPLGLASFTLACANPGGTAHIKIFYDKVYDTTAWKARKFVKGSFIDISGAVFGTADVGSTKVTTLSYDVTDGGILDSDGLTDGVIIDPAGPAQLKLTAPNTGFYNDQSGLKALMTGLSLLTAGVLSLWFIGRQHARFLGDSSDSE